MPLVESHWQKRQCRFENGIFFPNDEFIELCGSPVDGYRADLRTSIAILLRTTAEGWTELSDSCSVRSNDYSITAGSTPHEGAGFLAVEHTPTARLLWLLHLANSEPFTRLSCEGLTIHAVSEDYPFRCHWRIPLDGPESLSVSQIHIS